MLEDLPPSDGRRRRADALIGVAIAVLAVAAWHFRLIAPAQPGYEFWNTGDLFTQIYPMSFRAAEFLRAHTIPLWNPYQYCGHPLLATGIYGVLYPFNAFYLFMETASAMEAVVVFHLAVVGICTFVLARLVIRRRDAAFVAAVTFMLSGFIMQEAAWFPPALSAAAWLPLSMIALERLFVDPRPRWAVVLAVSMALSFLAGWPQTTLYVVYVMVAYAVARLLSLGPSDRARTGWIAFTLACAGVLALMLASAQLLPTLELQSLATRGVAGLSAEQALQLGVISPRELFARGVDARPGWPRLSYVGMASLVLMPLSLLTNSPRWRAWCWWLLGAFAVCVSVSVYTPVYRLYRLIGGASFHGPMRIMYIYGFAGAMLAGLGFRSVAEREEHARRYGAVLVAIAAAVLLLVGVPAVSRAYLCAAASLALVALLAHEGVARYARFALVVLIVCDVFFATKNTFPRPYVDRRALDRAASTLDHVRADQGLYRTYLSSTLDPGLTPKQGSLRGMYSVTDYEPLSIRRYATFFAAIEPPGNRVPPEQTFSGDLSADPSWPAFRLLDLMSVRFMVVPRLATKSVRNDLVQRRKWQLGVWAFGSPALVYENPAPLPRAYTVSHATVVSSEDAALQRVVAGDFDSRASVVLESADERERAASTWRTTPIVPATVTHYEPDRVVVTTATSAAPGYLVLTDTFYPGWKATVDGAPADIIRANYLFRAVRVDGGPHEVVFTYAPRSFRIGATLTMAGLAAAIVAVAVDLRRSVLRRRQKITHTHAAP